MKKFCIYFIVIILFTSCNSPVKEKDLEAGSDVIAEDDSALNENNILFQNWEINDAEHPMKKDLFDNTDSGVYNYPGLTFLNDSLLVENPRGEIRFGKFFMAGDNIYASFDTGKAVYKIKKISHRKMILLRSENDKKTLLYLRGDGNSYYARKINPFHPAYNKWRIKPLKPESDNEIKERLKNYVLFFAIFFKDNYRKASDDIDFLGLPCCFNWYQGGISIQAEKHLDRKFIECFYNKAQALQARQMLDDVIVKKYHWQKEEINWVKQTAPVLQQIHDSL